MRQRRAILFDDDSLVLNMLRLFFERRGYEVLAFRAAVLCPLYDGQRRCDALSPCGDILITDYRMPGMSGLALLQTLVQRKCKLPARNRAMVSGDMDPLAITVIDSLGCGRFEKPFTLNELEPWVRECEQRMDLSVPLKVMRKEIRRSCNANVAVRLILDSGILQARVVNWSASGLCVVAEQPLAVGQVLEVRAVLPPDPRRVVVRWTRSTGDGEFLAGMVRC